MTNKFKVGDTVRRISGNNCGVNEGDIATIIGVHSDGDYYTLDKGHLSNSHNECNLELVKSSDGKKVKVKPTELHLVLQNGCNNFVTVSSSYEDAIQIKPSGTNTNTVYKLIPVAKIENATKVTKIIEKRSKK
jgi:hypothetical protein